MGKNTSVEIGAELDSFVQNQVAVGRYGSASEVIRAGLRLLQDEEAKLAALRHALLKGEESGEASSFNVEDFIASRTAVSNG